MMLSQNTLDFRFSISMSGLPKNVLNFCKENVTFTLGPKK